MNEPEPWLRGPIDGVPAHLMPVFHSFRQVREDLRHWTAGISDQQVWESLYGAPALGFHLRHIAGSVERLTTYLMGAPLSESQLGALRREREPGASLAELLALVEKSLTDAEGRLRSIEAKQLGDARTVGRRGLPTTVLGLLVHLAEHTQRHLGQAITTASLVRRKAEGG